MTRDQYNSDVMALALFYVKRNADRRELDTEIDAIFEELRETPVSHVEKVDELHDQLARAMDAYRLPTTPPARDSDGLLLLTLTPEQSAALAQAIDAEADAATDLSWAHRWMLLALLLRGGIGVRLHPNEAAPLRQMAYDLDSVLDPDNDPVLASACEAVLQQLA